MGAKAGEKGKKPAEAVTGPRTFKLDDNAAGAINTMENVVVMTVVSRDANNLKAEYRAGFVQGKLQDRTIASARDNTWDNAYLTDPGHGFPKQPGPGRKELELASRLLTANYDYFRRYLKTAGTDTRRPNGSPCADGLTPIPTTSWRKMFGPN